MFALKEFCRSLPFCSGALAIVGLGVGYEYVLARRHAPQFEIVGYDTDPRALDFAKRLAVFAQVGDADFRLAPFPLNGQGGEGGGLAGIIACEVLEHLEDPCSALRAFNEQLRPGGRIFATMAVNLAQEDHLFWYSKPNQCEEQLRATGFDIIERRFAPIRVTPNARFDSGAPRGNYIAIAERSQELSTTVSLRSHN